MTAAQDGRGAAAIVDLIDHTASVAGDCNRADLIARLAEAFHLPVTSHGAHDITVQLLAACPNRSYLEAHGFGLETYIETPLQIVDGHAIAPDSPGHGVVFDWDRLETLRV